ncbi:MAG: hypothetical protein A2X13_11410 [Bacteroidetes bacterium GWC2_33_15]|nr:MAG: hypothetical protein A2X10_05435 [Bacteroidetes bacterium GWA2_33_15]OFX50748.1 MAG: hypothetical protein A2X13_11410 [Bacteroidetes bacterium GWC2_33_15]OFX62970.1 MAG: hypothetical protein A2X15_09960 [Bacteroidetes bacterium GWB2_32_14]OFX70039.1 MAG: hypothetical protein A2X14_02820 [Bacteroidetes bacterium GWD2_33_33]HAN19039.1 hypothetical protein [Bacteroidales bacterium]
MIKKYINLPLKNIIKQGSLSVISAIGLAIALSCCILIILYVQYEFSFDSFHKNAEQIFRIVQKQKGHSYMGSDVFAVTPGTLKEALVSEMPEVKYATKCILRSHIFEGNSTLFDEYGILYADQDFLKIFSFPIVSGDPAEALKEPFTLFLTKEMATKYFGNENPIGKYITADNKYVFTVKGILRDIPKNSHLRFDFITGFETLYSIRGGKENVDKWGSNSYITYFQLKGKVETEVIKAKLNDLYKKHTENTNLNQNLELIPESLNNIHLNGTINFDPSNTIDIRYIYLVLSIGVLILLIACFNYMNMAAARSFGALRTMGVLKVFGCNRRGLLNQSITESMLLSAFGLLIALFIIWFLLPTFSIFTGRPLVYSMIFQYKNIIKILGLILLVGIVAGLYPTVHLSSISPLQLIKQNLQSFNGKRKTGLLRNVLVVMQYIISITAIICTISILKQMNFIKKTDTGFARHNILTIYLRDPDLRKNPVGLIDELRKNFEIVEIATSANLPNTIGSNSNVQWENMPTDTKLPVYKAGIGYNFFEFYGLEIINGRGFSAEYVSDTVNRFVINQTAAKLIGWDDPIGKKFGFDRDNLGIVIGVVKDFNFHSLHLGIEPLAFSVIGCVDYPETRYISIKVNSEKIAETRIFTENTLKEMSPNYLNPVSVLSDRIDEMYMSDRNLSKILLFSTVLTIILTCLGQYGISSFTTRKRTKEMAIRKVNGAKSITIMYHLIWETAKLIFIAILFAWPIAYFIITDWMQNFAYRIAIGPSVFIYSLLITLLISLMVISVHIIKLSRVNPSELMRYE